MKAGIGVELRGRVESLNGAQAHNGPILALLTGGARLNAETGDQRVERQAALSISRNTEARRACTFKVGERKNSERYVCDQRPYFLIGTALQRCQSTFTDLT